MLKGFESPKSFCIASEIHSSLFPEQFPGFAQFSCQKQGVIRNQQFRHFPNHGVCFGCSALISKLLVSVFRYNRNIQRPFETNRNKKKWPFPCLCLCPLDESFTKKNRNRSSIGLFRFETKQKVVCFEDTLVKSRRQSHC